MGRLRALDCNIAEPVSHAITLPAGQMSPKICDNTLIASESYAYWFCKSSSPDVAYERLLLKTFIPKAGTD